MAAPALLRRADSVEEREVELRWYQRYTTARALDRMGGGWPKRTQKEEREHFRTRSQIYLSLMMSLDDEQLGLLQDYAENLQEERDYWNQRSFFLGYEAAMREVYGENVADFL